MRHAWVLAAAAATLLPGCSILDPCPAYDTVAWTDPSLYEALPPIPVENITPYAVASADVLGAPAGIVHNVRWDAVPANASVQVYHDRIMALSSDEGAARRALVTFLRAHSLADDDAIDRAVSTAMGSGEPLSAGRPGAAHDGPLVRMYAATPPGPWSFAEAFANATRLPDHDGLGRAAFEAGQYRIDVWFPVRATTIGGIPTRVDAEGKVEAQAGDRVGRDPQSSVERVRDAFVEAGATPPPPAAWAYSDPC